MTGHETIRWRLGVGQRRPSNGSLRAAHCRLQLCSLVLAGLLSLAAASAARAQAPPSVEYQVKAAFLVSFANFIEWPSGTFQNDKAPLNFCVFRHDPFGSTLDDVIRGKTINDREVLARRIMELPDLKSCQIIFVSNVEDKHLSEVVSSLLGTSALVVGESENFAERGGGVQFFLDANKVRFAVNVDATQRARLKVSSKLLALARIVHDRDISKGN